MAWTSMHFAVGMGCAGAAALAGCYVLRRGWRWVPAAMTAGGLWATVPDWPRLFREDFPNLPLASSLGSKNLEATLHDWGNLFFGHKALDAQPHEFALHGFVMMIVLYNLSIIHLLWLQRRQRLSIANRMLDAHEAHEIHAAKARQRRKEMHDVFAMAGQPDNAYYEPPTGGEDDHHPLQPFDPDGEPVIYRIQPQQDAEGA